MYHCKLKLELDKAVKKPVKLVEKQSGEDENPQHFIHEINTTAYDVSDVTLFLRKNAKKGLIR